MLILFFIGCLGCSEKDQDSAAPVADTAPNSESEDSSSPEDSASEEDTSEVIND